MDNIKRLNLEGREIILVGTAHVSKDSADEVSRVINAEKPDTVCIELDEGRLASMMGRDTWKKLDIIKIIREGKGFLVIANLALGGFQRRIGNMVGAAPGEEMKTAVETASSLGIPYTLCDREVQITLRRAWAHCGFWGKSKLLASLLSSAFSTEQLSGDEVEQLKDKSALDAMLAELSAFLPSVKETLIDERDQYLAAKIWESPGEKLVCVVGAGHLGGLAARLEQIASAPSGAEKEERAKLCDVSGLEQVPPKSLLSRLAPAIIPIVIAALIAAGFVKYGASASLSMLLRWLILNGGGAAVGALIALAHPLAILAAIVGAPIGTLSPVLSVGMFAGVAQAALVRPRVGDAEDISGSVTSLKGIYQNRITRALLVFLLSSLGGMLGNLISVPSLAGLL